MTVTLSGTSAETVRATLPVLGTAIDEITSVFYRRMFAAHPELRDDLFNRGSQAQGDQQRALAGSIVGFAKLLVEEDQPDPVALLSRIAHKHAALGVTSEQYDIVHKYLFDAIAEILGDTLTPEIAGAWDEVYWLMADALRAQETELYSAAGVAEGDVWRHVVVQRREQESPDTVAFVLEAPDETALPGFHPGQYISVQVPLPDGARQIRQYSLSNAPEHGRWRISVKRIPEDTDAEGQPIPAGEVSNFLHDNVFDGDELRVSLPFGDLILDDSVAPLLLVSAGIGCTPMIGMLDHLAYTRARRPVTVLHADRCMSRHAHRRELQELVDELPNATLHHWYEDLGARTATPDTTPGLIDLDGVDLQSDAQIYLCGPMPFMRSVRDTLAERGVPAEHVHYEVFNPEQWEAAA